MAFGARGLGSCAWTGVGVRARVLRGFGGGRGVDSSATLSCLNPSLSHFRAYSPNQYQLQVD